MRRGDPLRITATADSFGNPEGRHPTLVIDREAFGHNAPVHLLLMLRISSPRRRAGDRAAWSFQRAALTGFARGAGMEAKAVHPSQQRNRGFSLQRRNTVKSEGLATCVRADRNPVVNGRCLNLVEARSKRELQAWVDGISDQ